MKTLNNLLFFSQQYGKSLGKKWKSLLLLFIAPILMIACIAVLVVMLLVPTEEQPIELVLVDEDQTKESGLMAQLLLLTVANNDYLHVEMLTAEEANEAMAANEITSYLTFPAGFTEDLYVGNAVTLQLVGHPSKMIDSYIIRELINSLARYIESAQANILTMYDYGKKIPLSKEDQKTLVYEQFMNFSMYTLGKGNLLWEKEIENLATSAPLYYYSIAAAFVLLTIWLLGVYVLLRKEESTALKIRMKLLGVTEAQRMLARLVWAVIVANGWGIVVFSVLCSYLELPLYALDYARLLLFSVLYSVCYVLVVMLVDASIRSMRIGLVVHVAVLVTLLVASGAVIPTLYFPLAMQAVLPFIFSYDAFNWLVDIAIEERNYAQYGILCATAGLLFLLFITLEQLKARWQA